MTWDDFKDELHDEIRQPFEWLLPDFLSHRLYGDPEERRRPYERQRAEAKKRVNEEIEELRALRTRLHTDIVPAKTEKARLPDDASAVHDRLQEKLKSIERLRSDINARYLRQAEIDELLEIRVEFEEYDEYIPNRQRYEQQWEKAIGPYRDKIQFLRELHNLLKDNDSPAEETKESLVADKANLYDRLYEELETVEQLKDELDYQYLWQYEIDELDRIESTLEQQERELRDAKREYVKSRFQDEIAELRQLEKRLRTDVEPAKTSGTKLPNDAEDIHYQLEPALEIVTQLRTDFDKQWFSEREREELQQLESLFEEYRDFIPEQWCYERRRNNAKERFEEDIDDLRSLGTRVRDLIAPVKTAGETLPNDALVIEEQLEDRYDTLEQLKNDVDEQYLQQEEFDELRDLRLIFQEYRTYISKRRDVEKQLYGELDALRPLREQVESEIIPAKLSSKSLPNDAAAIQDQLADGLKTTVELRTNLDEQYLHPYEIKELADMEQLFDEYQVFISEKRRFDQLIAPLEEQFTSLESDVAPFIEYDKYLTRHRREALEQSSEAIRRERKQIRQEIKLDVLGEADQTRFSDIEVRHVNIDNHLDGYNVEFVERQTVACDELFSDIDDEGNDLNDAQRKAIIRNDTYNQVVAAAGTGKTVALIFRIAYLVREQGVPPQRIAALTYTREAAQEMETRLDRQFGITDVEVQTIHSFGFRIAQDAAAEKLNTVESTDVYNLIDCVIQKEQELPSSEFYEHYLEFLSHYEDDYAEEADFEERTDYIAERAEESYETLAGESVASRAEKVIGDFLFTHDVDYRYEAIAEWADVAEDKDAYRPDFYLPKYDLYIEHWGLDEAGEVAPWFSWTTEEYVQKLRWGRSEFEESDSTLVETYDFEHQRSPLHLKHVLRHRLKQRGVELDRLNFENLVDATFEYHEREKDIKDSFKQFIDNAKTFDIAPEEIEERLDKRIPRQYHFGRCGEIMLRRYNEYLARNNLVDFDDMIYDAIAAVERYPEIYCNEYDHLLVDEFQDVAMSQLRLIRQLGGSNGARLFCVGDDWQSIYSFQGSEVKYFIDFEEHVGPAATTRLTSNYRCPKPVLDAGNDLIDNNPAQIDKTVTAASGRETTPKLHTLEGYTDNAYERRVGKYVAELVEQDTEDESGASDVMVLCRYDDAAPYLDEVKKRLERRDIPYDGKEDHFRPPGMPSEYDPGFNPDAGVSVFSVHQSKGREAEHVILLHAAKGQFGFPAEDRKDDLIAPVRDVETNSVAEERRLFYVGITRTKESLHIQTRQGSESPFIEEVDEHFEKVRSIAAPGEVGETTTITAKVDRLFENPHPTQRQAGVLKDQTGTVRFISWENENPPMLEEGVWYRLNGVGVNEYKKESQIILRGDAEVVNLYSDAHLNRSHHDE